MFGLNKNKIDQKQKGKSQKIDDLFGSKDYQMNEYYNADSLVVARLERVSDELHDSLEEYGPKDERTMLKYIFEVIADENSELRYREIFTGFIAKSKEEYFMLPYVIEPEPFTKYFPETIGCNMPKLSLIWTLNEINFPEEKTKVRSKSKE